MCVLYWRRQHSGQQKWVFWLHDGGGTIPFVSVAVCLWASCSFFWDGDRWTTTTMPQRLVVLRSNGDGSYFNFLWSESIGCSIPIVLAAALHGVSPKVLTTTCAECRGLAIWSGYCWPLKNGRTRLHWHFQFKENMVQRVVNNIRAIRIFCYVVL